MEPMFVKYLLPSSKYSPSKSFLGYQCPTPADLTESFRFVAVMNSNTQHKAMNKGNRYTFGGEVMSFTC